MTEQELLAEIKRKDEALAKIEKWFGEFPPTGQFWAGSRQEMSYSAAYGSNGERDYMRGVARQALQPPSKPKKRYAVAKVELPQEFSAHDEVGKYWGIPFTWRIEEEQ